MTHMEGKMKKLLKMAVVAAMVLGGLTACSSSSNEGGNEQEEKCPIKIGLVTDTGGIDDKSFNQGTWEGILAYAEENNLSSECYKYLQSTSDADYVPFLSQMGDDGMDIIIAPGFLFIDALNEVAPNYPDTSFVIIDDVVDQPNVASALFNAQEPSYLVGVAAAMKAKEAGATKVGYVGGMEFDTILAFEAGYREGVASVDPSIEVLCDYIGDFVSADKGKALAQKQFNNGAYVVYQVAGSAGNGVIAEGKERREKGEDVWVIGVDKDQYADGLLTDGTSVVLTSALKHAGAAAKECIELHVAGKFPGGQSVVASLSTGGVDYTTTNTAAMSQDIIDAVESAKAKIIKGEIVVGTKPQR